MADKEPRGIRNNNPGNIEWGSSRWQNSIAKEDSEDSRFVVFKDAPSGIRAIAVTLLTYFNKRLTPNGEPIDTVAKAITRWAPAGENDTGAYIHQVCVAVSKMTDSHVDPDTVLDFHKYEVICGIVAGIIRHENGPGPKKTINEWYAPAVVDEGVRRAGVVPDDRARFSSEAKAAGGIAAVGGVDIADVAPSVYTAVTSSHGDLTSGQWFKVAIGIATVALAVYIAWKQIKRRQAGAI